MSDIAAKAGTSVAAVSVTLNGAKSKTLKVSAETRQRIIEAAQELGYRRNPYAGALATGQSRILGLMLPSASAYSQHDPFYSLLTTGITTCAQELGYNVMLYSAAAEDEPEKAARLIDKLVAGLVLVSPPENTPLYEECDRLRIPFVTVLAGPQSGRLTINSDDYRGGRMATEHLIAQGHRRIAHLKGRSGVVTTLPRYRGYVDALREYGLSIEPALTMPGDFNLACAYESTRRLALMSEGERPTAIFAANDLSAHGAIDAIADCGLKTPDDIAVVGYDDTWYATVTRPALTSVNMDVAGIGYQAARALLRLITSDGPRETHIVLPVSLTVRESCGVKHAKSDPSTSSLENSYATKQSIYTD